MSKYSNKKCGLDSVGIGIGGSGNGYATAAVVVAEMPEQQHLDREQLPTAMALVATRYKMSGIQVACRREYSNTGEMGTSLSPPAKYSSWVLALRTPAIAGSILTTQEGDNIDDYTVRPVHVNRQSEAGLDDKLVADLLDLKLHLQERHPVVDDKSDVQDPK